MKKIILVLSVILLLSIGLTGCSFDVSRPEIKEGRFNVTVTYELDGEVKKASGVYVCKYKGIAWTLEGVPYVNWKESYEGDINENGVISLGKTEDGGELLITFLFHPEYFMGDPECSEWTPIVTAEVFYDDRQIDDPDEVAEYGLRLIDCEYDKPIENTYK